MSPISPAQGCPALEPSPDITFLDFQIEPLLLSIHFPQPDPSSFQRLRDPVSSQPPTHISREASVCCELRKQRRAAVTHSNDCMNERGWECSPATPSTSLQYRQTPRW